MPSPLPALRPTAPCLSSASVAAVRALAACLLAVVAAGTVQAQTQSGLWRSAMRASGSGAGDGGWGPAADTPWERALRAGPGLADERFAWRYTWQDTGRYALWTGVGGALRESRHALSPGGYRSFDPAAGLSPMLAAGGEWRLAPGWRLMAEFDGVGGPRGRTLDLDARVQWDLSPQWYLGAGWRVLDATFDSPRGGGYGRWSGAAFSAGWRF